MIKKILPLIFFIIMYSAGFSQYTSMSKIKNEFPRLIEFQVTVIDKYQLEHLPDGFSPYINLGEPEEDLKNLVNPNEIVLKKNQAILIIDYPVAKNIEYEISSSSKNGFTKKELIEIICEKYKQIYDEAKKSSKGSAQRNNLFFSSPLNHYDMSEIEVEMNSDGKIIITLGIDS